MIVRETLDLRARSRYRSRCTPSGASLAASFEEGLGLAPIDLEAVQQIQREPSRLFITGESDGPLAKTIDGLAAQQRIGNDLRTKKEPPRDHVGDEGVGQRRPDLRSGI